MELPDSIKTLGEQVEAGSDIQPAAELFEAYPVFAAEVAQLFTRPWLAVDHVSRLAGDGDYFRAEVGSRSIVLVREAPDRIHALRNACLHAGYRVCEEESGRGDHLFCQYHGWAYALDRRLPQPLFRPEPRDRSPRRPPARRALAAGAARWLAVSPAALRDADRARVDPGGSVGIGAGAAAARPRRSRCHPGSPRRGHRDEPQALPDELELEIPAPAAVGGARAGAEIGR